MPVFEGIGFDHGERTVAHILYCFSGRKVRGKRGEAESDRLFTFLKTAGQELDLDS